MGIKQQSAGKAFQDFVKVQMSVVRPRVLLVETYPKVIFPGGVPKVTKKAVPDFFMTWQGRPFLFDAKTTQNKTRYKPYKAQSHQFEWMKRADQAGSVAGYMMEWKERTGPHLVEFYQVTQDKDPQEFMLYRGHGDCQIDLDIFQTFTFLLDQMMDLVPGGKI